VIQTKPAMQRLLNEKCKANGEMKNILQSHLDAHDTVSQEGQANHAVFLTQ
jgi:hypothetical protein